MLPQWLGRLRQPQQSRAVDDVRSTKAISSAKLLQHYERSLPIQVYVSVKRARTESEVASVDACIFDCKYCVHHPSDRAFLQCNRPLNGNSCVRLCARSCPSSHAESAVRLCVCQSAALSLRGPVDNSFASLQIM